MTSALLCAECVSAPATVEAQRATYKGKTRKVLLCPACAGGEGSRAILGRMLEAAIAYYRGDGAVVPVGSAIDAARAARSSRK